MKRFVNSAVLFGLVLALLSVVFQPVASAEKRDDKGSKARLTWSTRKVQETLAAGTSKTVTVTFTSSGDLADVQLRVSGGLARFVTVSPGTVASVKANTPVSVQIVMQVPADKAHDQGGVIQVRAGKRNMGKPLQVKIDVPGDDDEDEDEDD